MSGLKSGYIDYAPYRIRMPEKGEMLVLNPDLKTDPPSYHPVPTGTDGKRLKMLQQFVGGLIEVVPAEKTCQYILVINEEGKLRDLPFNGPASMLWEEMNPLDVIVGSAVVMHTGDLE